jgi:hypothetical protein
LNLADLNDLKISKAYQLDKNPNVQQNPSPAKAPQEHPVEVPKIKILNKQASESSKPPLKTSSAFKLAEMSRNDVNLLNKRPPKRSIEHSPSISPSSKHIKLIIPPAPQDEFFDESPAIHYEEVTPNKPILNSPQMTPLKEIPIIEAQQEPPQNKLLALFEVTADQYKELSERLSASERNNKIESLVTSFLDKEENETGAANENGEI